MFVAISERPSALRHASAKKIVRPGSGQYAMSQTGVSVRFWPLHVARSPRRGASTLSPGAHEHPRWQRVQVRRIVVAAREERAVDERARLERSDAAWPVAAPPQRHVHELRAHVGLPARSQRELTPVVGRAVALVPRVEERALPHEASPAARGDAQLLLDAGDARRPQVLGPRVSVRVVLPLDEIADLGAEDRRTARDAHARARASTTSGRRRRWCPTPA